MVTYDKQKRKLLDLAKQVAEIAALPIQQKTLKEWKALNSLKPVRPMFMIDQFYWEDLANEEMNYESEEELNKYRYSAKNTWACGMAQIFSMVSPGTHLEFEIEYQKKYYSRFGLGYYGCCEPLDKKIDIIRQIPNVRKISMSPWVNMEAGSEAMGGGYVFSRKPSPAPLANDKAWDAAAVKKDLEDACQAADKYGNPCEIILKDITTLGGKPERLWEWAKIAAGVCGR